MRQPGLFTTCSRCGGRVPAHDLGASPTALDALGRPDEARAQLRRAFEVDPTSPTPYLRLAVIYAREGQLGYVRTLVAVAGRLPRRSSEDEALLALLACR